MRNRKKSLKESYGDFFVAMAITICTIMLIALCVVAGILYSCVFLTGTIRKWLLDAKNKNFPHGAR